MVTTVVTVRDIRAVKLAVCTVDGVLDTKAEREFVRDTTVVPLAPALNEILLESKSEAV